MRKGAHVRAGLGAAAMSVATLAFAGSAMADADLGTVDGLTYIQDSITLDAAPAKGKLTADCPNGSALLGGGVTPTSSPLEELRVLAALPVDGDDKGSMPDDGFKGKAANIGGGSKGFSAYAVCSANSVAYETATAKVAHKRSAAVKADCPAGSWASTGGGSVSGPSGALWLNSSHPFDDPGGNTEADDGWRARAFNDSGAKRKLKVTVACVQIPLAYSETDLSGLGSVPCASDAQHAIGGGIEAAGGRPEAHLNTLYPYATPTNPPDAGFVLAMGAPSLPAPAFTGHLICWVPPT